MHQKKCISIVPIKASTLHIWTKPHPNDVISSDALPVLYRSRMERLQEALEGDAEDQDALELVRSLIERIDLHPLEGSGFEIEVVGATSRR